MRPGGVTLGARERVQLVVRRRVLRITLDDPLEARTRVLGTVDASVHHAEVVARRDRLRVEPDRLFELAGGVGKIRLLRGEVGEGCVGRAGGFGAFVWSIQYRIWRSIESPSPFVPAAGSMRGASMPEKNTREPS